MSEQLIARLLQGIYHEAAHFWGAEVAKLHILSGRQEWFEALNPYQIFGYLNRR